MVFSRLVFLLGDFGLGFGVVLGMCGYEVLGTDTGWLVKCWLYDGGYLVTLCWC